MSFFSKTPCNRRVYSDRMRIFFFLVSLVVAQAQDADLSKLAFMTGCWEMKINNGSIEEQWTFPKAGTMLGMGRTVIKEKTAFHEFQKISVEQGKLTYTARIGTPGVTLFPVLRISDTEVVFENPTHDFPQRVIYRKDPKGLFARIEGMEKGREKHQDFSYTRAACN